MKDKLKTMIVSFGISYMIIVVILMFISYSTSSKYIVFGNNNYQGIIAEYQEKANNIKEDSCREYFNNFLSYISKTNYTGKVEITTISKDTILNEEERLLSYYLKGIDACSKLTRELAEEESLPLLFLTANIANDTLLEKYSFQYELQIPDRIIRTVVSPELGVVQNKIKVESELEIVDKIYKIVSDEVENEN